MVKRQFIELLKLRGITENPNAKSLNKLVEDSGGFPDKYSSEMAQVNENVMYQLFDIIDNLEKKNKDLTKKVSLMQNSINTYNLQLTAFNQFGIHNWEYYDDSMEYFNKLKKEE